MRRRLRRTDDERSSPVAAGRQSLVAALALAACGDDDDTDSGGDSGSGGAARSPSCCRRRQTARYETQDKPLFEQKVAGALPGLRDPLPERRPGSGQAAVAGRGRGDRGRRRDRPRPGRLDRGGGMVTRAQQADIPVISYDRLILDADLAAYAEFNSPEVGKQQGEALADKLKEDGNPTGPDRPDQRRPEGQQREVVQGGRDRGVRGARASRSPRSTTRPTGCPRTPRRRWTRRSPRSARTASTASSPPTTAPPAARSRRSRAPASTRDDPGHRSGRGAGGDPAGHRR